ncbi:unnamed protein product [Ilex paraguariensis]|uniref:EF-hand domain-containing protein n=1 Tax=Ilex paraguariensis TaxID=185542 RepID=A0ABC8RQX2_9AQUA
MVISLLFLALLFIVGLINTIFNLPTKKIKSWFESFYVKAPPQVVVSNSSMAEKKVKSDNIHNKAEIRSVFATFDKNNDGYITKQELRESLKNIGIFMEEREVVGMIEKVDSNGDGLIDLDEFCELFGDLEGRREKERSEDEGGGEGYLKEAFDVFDGDGDGLITVEELGLVLSSLGFKEGKKLEDCKEMIRKVDLDGDGMVNLDEFKTMMKAGGRLVSIS